MNYFENKNNEIEYLRQFYTDAQIDAYAKGSQEKITKLYNLCQPKKVTIGSLKNKVNSKMFMVTSPDGYVPVLDCIEKTKDTLYKIQFSTGEVITASHDHLYQLVSSKWVYARELSVGNTLIHSRGKTTVEKIEEIKEKTKVYDLAVDHINHRYYTNNVCSHNSGKSLFMQNLGVNWMSSVLNGVYITLELSEELTAMRIDSMIGNIATRDIFKDLDTVEMKIRMMGKRSGKLQIKYMPAQSTVNDIRAYLKELEITRGFRADFLLVDYLDLLMPVSAKVSPNDLFVKDKYVSEELRNLAKELNCVFVTASQLNRGAVEEIEFDHSHISGGISKINTADNVFGIFTSRAMRERGRYQLQLMKTRSSSGVGQKIDLEFDVESLRIRDLGEDEDNPATPNKIMDQLKSSSRAGNDDVGKITANVQSSKLKDMLASLKNNS